MYLKNTEFNHDSTNWEKAIGMNENLVDVCYERILFAVFSNALQVHEHYNHPNEAPMVLKSRSGDLKLVLNLLEDPKEYEFSLLIFNTVHQFAIDCYNRHLIMISKTIPATKKLELEFLQKMENLEDEKEGTKGTYRSSKEAIKRIELVKKAGYNFEKYLLLVDGLKFASDVDELISKAISKY